LTAATAAGGRLNLTRETIEIQVLPQRLSAVLEGQASSNRRPTGEGGESSITISVPARLRRTGMESRLPIDPTTSARVKPDHSLHRVLAQAHRFRAMVMASRGKTIVEIAGEAGVAGSYFTRILRLSFLAPNVVKAILRNRHPITLTAKRLVNESRIPIAWDEHRGLLVAD